MLLRASTRALGIVTRRPILRPNRLIGSTVTSGDLAVPPSFTGLKTGQQTVVDACFRDENNTRELVVAPTGYGKTAIMSKVIEKVALLFTDANRPFKALMVSDRVELHSQSYEKFSVYVPSLSTSKFDGGDKDWNGSVVFGTIQALIRNLDRVPHINILCMDECHHGCAESYERLIERLLEINPQLKIVGVTATPFRGDNKRLEDVFPGAPIVITYEQALNEGMVVPVVLKGVNQEQTGLNPDEIDRYDSMGDETKFAALVDARPVTNAVVKTWLDEGSDRQTLVFCSNIDHAEHVFEAFKAAGVAAGVVHSGRGKDEVERTKADYASKRLRVLVNVDMLREGYDNPATSCIVLLRPSSLLGPWRQSIGRGTRTDFSNPLKVNCLVLDFGVSSRRHKDEPELVWLRAPAEEEEDVVEGAAAEVIVNRDRGGAESVVQTSGFTMEELSAGQKRLSFGANQIPFYGVVQMGLHTPWVIGEAEGAFCRKTQAREAVGVGYVAQALGQVFCGVFKRQREAGDRVGDGADSQAESQAGNQAGNQPGGEVWVTVCGTNSSGERGAMAYSVEAEGGLWECLLAAETFFVANERPSPDQTSLIFAAKRMDIKDPTGKQLLELDRLQRRWARSSKRMKDKASPKCFNVTSNYQATIVISLSKDDDRRMKDIMAEHFRASDAAAPLAADG